MCEKGLGFTFKLAGTLTWPYRHPSGSPPFILSALDLHFLAFNV